MLGSSRWARLLAITFVILLATSAAAGVVGAADTFVTAPAGATYETDSGLRVTVATDHGSTQDPFDGTDAVRLSNVTVSAGGPANITIDQIRGTWTNTSSINASANAVTIAPVDKSNVTVSGGVTALSFQDAEIDGTAQFTYSASSSGTVTLTGLPADTEFAAATTGGDVLTTGTTDGSGSAEVSVDAGTDVQVALTDPTAPIVDNSTLSPSDGANLSERNTELSVDVADADFGTEAGDTLTAEYVVDGSVAATDTVSSNGTSSATVSGLEGGSHDWYIRVTDDYGKTATSETHTFNVPATLEIYNESTDPKLLKNASTTVQFYYDNGTSLGYAERSPENGTVDLAGLPTGQPFVVVAETDGYYQRRIFVRSLYDQQEIYLLNESKQSVETIFGISDYSGAYPQDTTVLEVQRAINGSWKTVEGDYFGATGEFGTTLEYNARYRLVLYNTGTQESRVLGIYQPTTAQQTRITVSPSGEIEEIEREPSAVISPQTRRLPAVNGTTVQAEFRNNSRTVSEWRVKAVVEETNTTLWNETVSDTDAFQHDLDAATLAGQHVRVQVFATIDGEELDVESTRFTIADTPTNDNSLLSTLADLEGLAAPGTTESFTWFLAMLVTVVGVAGVATALPVGGETAGLAGVLILVGFSAIGWVSYDVVFAAGVAVVSLALLRRGL